MHQTIADSESRSRPRRWQLAAFLRNPRLTNRLQGLNAVMGLDSHSVLRWEWRGYGTPKQNGCGVICCNTDIYWWHLMPAGEVLPKQGVVPSLRKPLKLQSSWKSLTPKNTAFFRQVLINMLLTLVFDQGTWSGTLIAAGTVTSWSRK